MSFGFATEAEKRDGAWTNPVGTCLFHKYVQLGIKQEGNFFPLVFLTPLLFCISNCVFWIVCSNGRAVHYNGSSLLQWKSVRLDVALLPGEMG